MSAVDPDLLRLAQEYVSPGAVVWDVGANLGLFTVAAASLAGTQGQVISFEPDSWLIRLLQRSSRSQPKASATIRVVPVAVADEVTIREFCISQHSRSENYLLGHGYSPTQNARERITVMAVSLDWCLERLPAPQVVKVDVEGAEVDVLQGAQRLLGIARPTFIMEVGPRNADKVASVFEKNRSAIYDGTLPKCDRTPLKKAPWTTVAIPEPA
jgi:FkbM family methyltransferase